MENSCCEVISSGDFTRINEKDEYGETLYHNAAEYGHLKCLKVLISLDETEGVSSINEKSDYNTAPLHYAAMCGHSECVDFLVSNGGGAHINEKDNGGKTPLHYAAMCGYLECMKVLIVNGANIDEKDNNGRTPFELMSEEKEIKIKEYIKEIDEDPLLVKGVVGDF